MKEVVFVNTDYKISSRSIPCWCFDALNKEHKYLENMVIDEERSYFYAIERYLVDGSIKPEIGNTVLVLKDGFYEANYEVLEIKDKEVVVRHLLSHPKDIKTVKYSDLLYQYGQIPYADWLSEWQQLEETDITTDDYFTEDIRNKYLDIGNHVFDHSGPEKIYGLVKEVELIDENASEKEDKFYIHKAYKRTWLPGKGYLYEDHPDFITQRENIESCSFKIMTYKVKCTCCKKFR